MFFTDINDKQCSRKTVLVSDTIQHAAQLIFFTGDHQTLALVDILESTVSHHTVEVGHFLDRLTNGGKIGKHSTQPTLTYVWHAHTLCFSSYKFFSLFFSGYE